MGEDLGMNIFLGDEFFEEDSNQENNINPNDHVIDQTEEDVNNDDIQNNDDHVDDENQEGVDVDNTEDENDADKNTGASTSPPLYKSLASVLHEQGVLTSVDSSKLEKVETVQDLADLIASEVKAKELLDLTDLQKEAVAAFRAGIDIETFQQQKNLEEQLSSIKEEDLNSDEDLRRQLIYQQFINQGFNEQKAERLTNRSFEADDDIEDAKDALESIKKGVQEKFSEQIKYNEEVQRKALEDAKNEQERLKKVILESEEPLKGIKVNATIRKQIFDTMMNPVSKNPNTGVEENALMKDQRESKDFTQRLYAAYTLTKGFTDFGYFGKAEKTKAINELEKALKNNQHVISGGDASFIDDPNASDYDIGDTVIFR